MSWRRIVYIAILKSIPEEQIIRTLNDQELQVVSGGSAIQKYRTGSRDGSGAESPPPDGGTDNIMDGVSELDTPWYERFTGVGPDCDQSDLEWHERLTPITCAETGEPLPIVRFENAFQF